MDRFHTSLAENLITVLCYDDVHGKLLAGMLDPALMEGDYRVIAERAIDYWADYKRCPGDHSADLVADIIEDKHNRRAGGVKRVLTSMAQLADTVNTEYVMNQLRTFNRMQRIKGAIIESADKINANSHMAIGEIENIWNGILRTQEIDFDPGLRMTDLSPIISRLELLQSEFVMGIEHLDHRNVIPARGQLLMWLAAAGRGKTWALVHCGAQALAARKKVLHVTLEVDAEFIAQRYFQKMLGITKRHEEYDITTMSTDLGRLEELSRETIKAEFAWDSKHLRVELEEHMKSIGIRRFENLIIKRFPPNTLTANGLRTFLDTLEQTEKFIPDMIIVDYAGIMKIDLKNVRGSIGNNVLELRSIAIERNAAMVTAHQSSKAGEEAALMTATHVAEDWSIVGTADVIITYSVTNREFNHGLARLFVAKCRTEEDRFALLVTQSYKMGAFCIQSFPLAKNYPDLLTDLAGDADDDDDTGSDDDE